jgi:hypothetical protein
MVHAIGDIMNNLTESLNIGNLLEWHTLSELSGGPGITSTPKQNAAASTSAHLPLLSPSAMHQCDALVLLGHLKQSMLTAAEHVVTIDLFDDLKIALKYIHMSDIFDEKTHIDWLLKHINENMGSQGL